MVHILGGRANEAEGMASVKVLRPEQARPLQERGRGGRGWRGRAMLREVGRKVSRAPTLYGLGLLSE